MELLQREHGVDLSRTCVVGDRLDTDVALGKGNGAAATALVLTGVAGENDVEAAVARGNTTQVPDLVLDSLSCLL